MPRSGTCRELLCRRSGKNEKWEEIVGGMLCHRKGSFVQEECEELKWEETVSAMLYCSKELFCRSSEDT